MNKPRSRVRPLAELTTGLLADSFRKQGFASAELVTRWPAIVGEEIAACAEPLKIQWPRGPDAELQAPGTLVLRVEGPAAIEIQHLSQVILERVNRYFGWPAVARVAIRQAPLRRSARPKTRAADPAAMREIAGKLGEVADEELRMALARLGAAVKGK